MAVECSKENMLEAMPAPRGDDLFSTPGEQILAQQQASHIEFLRIGCCLPGSSRPGWIAGVRWSCKRAQRGAHIVKASSSCRKSRLTSFAAAVAALGISAAAAAATTPTVSEFLNAANAEYLIDTVPTGMHAFTDGGVPVTFVDNANGVVASVFVTAQGQLIIAFQGTTGGLNFFVDPIAAASQLITDIGIFLDDAAGGVTPAAYRVALTFANTVVGIARAQGFSTDNIFVTGHSLGGIEAEFVAQQTGLGGVGFEPTGLATQPVAAATGLNFVNIVTQGDPVGNFSSDIQGEQPFAPAFGAPHYGQIVLLGSSADQKALSSAVANANEPLFIPIVLLNTFDLLLEFHLPGVQAHDAGVALNPTSPLIDAVGNLNGPVLDVANDTIPQLIQQAATAGRLIQP